MYRGLQVNANKVIFWMLLNIVSSPNILARIRDEIGLYAKMTEGELKLDINSIISNCPLFKASFYETMRLYTAGLSYKKVLQDLTLTEREEDAALFGK